MTHLQAIILGIVEGITEFLPISSTGHLIITAKLLELPDSTFVKTFEVVIQLGAILAVVAIYARRLLVDRERLLKLMAAFLPTVVIGLAMYKIIKHYFLGNADLTAWSLIIGGVVLVAFEFWHKKHKPTEQGLEKLTYRDAVLIGLCQSLAMIPGVSRAAATIVGALWLGYKRESAVEFSFLLAIPTMLAASALDLYKSAGSITSSEYSLLAIGFVTAFIVALGAVLWLLKYIKTHTFTSFGVYRIIAGIIFLLII